MLRAANCALLLTVGFAGALVFPKSWMYAGANKAQDPNNQRLRLPLRAANAATATTTTTTTTAAAMSTTTPAASSRLDEVFASCREKHEAALVTYVTAGYPHPGDTVDLLLALEAGGADVIELGVPFSDPQADGSTIQATNQVALKAGVDIAACLHMTKEARARGLAKPVVLMGYYNPFLQFGLEQLVSQSSDSGVDGFIVVDLPPEEGAPFVRQCHSAGLAFVPLVAPTTTDTRMKYLASAAASFIYCVSVTGVTGSRGAVAPDLAEFVARIRRQTALPLAVGFGIGTPEQVEEVARVADGVVVGSAILNVLVKAPSDSSPAAKAESLRSFVASLKAGTKRQAKEGRSAELAAVPTLQVLEMLAGTNFPPPRVHSLSHWAHLEPFNIDSLPAGPSRSP
jgi:tryptophan synthase